MTDRIALLTCGPAEHGISRFGRDLAGAAVELGFTGTVVHVPDPHRLADAVRELPSGVRLVHLQANDWLFTDAVHRAPESIRTLSEMLTARDVRLSLTLHDLPHQGVSRELFLRRARSYRDMMAAAVSTVVSSDHEHLLVDEALSAVQAEGGHGAGPPEKPSVTVIPLPIPAPVAGIPGSLSRAAAHFPAATVGILGYLYPGKGHREVLRELAGAVPPVAVVALGRPSDGHEALLAELIELGRGLGVGLTCTGFVPDAEMAAWLREVPVAVAPATQISASASINSWIGAGRRPLVAAGRYAYELQRRMPGCITVYQPGELRARVDLALRNPSATQLPAGFRPSPDRFEVAARYLQWWRSTAAR